MDLIQFRSKDIQHRAEHAFSNGMSVSAKTWEHNRDCRIALLSKAHGLLETRNSRLAVIIDSASVWVSVSQLLVVSRLWGYWEVEKLLGNGTCWRKVGHWVRTLKGYWNSGLFLSFFQLSWGEQSPPPGASATMIPEIQNHRANCLWTETSGATSPNKPFLLVTWFSRRFLSQQKRADWHRKQSVLCWG